MDHNGAESRMWPVGHAFDLGPPRSLDNLNSHKVIDVVEERRCLDIDQMLEAQNARRRSSGRPERTETDVRAQVAEDERWREELRRRVQSERESEPPPA